MITHIGQLSTVIGIIVLAIYFKYELKQKSPVFDVTLFRTKTFTAYNIAGMFGYFAAVVFSTLINYYFRYVKGFDPQFTGLILIVSPIVMSIMAPYAGKLSDRMHPQKIATVGMVITAVSMVILAFLGKNTPLYVIIAAMVLQAFGMGLFSSPNLNAIMSSVNEKDIAYASAGQLSSRAVGQSLSLGILTLVFSWVMGNLQISSQYADLILKSSHIIFMICAIACILAIIASIVGIKADSQKYNE